MVTCKLRTHQSLRGVTVASECGRGMQQVSDMAREIVPGHFIIDAVAVVADGTKNRKRRTTRPRTSERGNSHRRVSPILCHQFPAPF